MQNRYVADVGDFGKFGLLRALCASPETPMPLIKLGVVWYLVPDESHNNDGKHITYLEVPGPKRELYRECDPDLYHRLAEIHQSGIRDVKAIRRHGVLPEGTVFYEEPLDFEGVKSKNRIDHRRRWLENALEMTARCDLIFVDPDNGLQVKIGACELKGPKYVFFEELSPFLQLDKSVVIYHHINRRGKAHEQIHARLAQIKYNLSGGNRAMALLYHRGSARVFFIIPSSQQESALSKRVGSFMNGPWSRHFELVSN
jgi:hypothetical protein